MSVEGSDLKLKLFFEILKSKDDFRAMKTAHLGDYRSLEQSNSISVHFNGTAYWVTFWSCFFITQLILITFYSMKCKASINHHMLISSHYQNYSDCQPRLYEMLSVLTLIPEKVCRTNWTSTLVCLGSYNKIPQTGKLINNRNLYLLLLEAGVQDQGTNMVHWGPLLAHGLLVVPSRVEEAGGLCGASFMGSNSIREASVLMA